MVDTIRVELGDFIGLSLVSKFSRVTILSGPDPSLRVEKTPTISRLAPPLYNLHLYVGLTGAFESAWLKLKASEILSGVVL
jgi:hypothetical protein